MGLDHNSSAVLEQDTGHAADTRLMEQPSPHASAKYLQAK
jgi:hypothetical protein